MDNRQRQQQYEQHRTWQRKQRARVGNARLHYTDEEYALLTVWDDMGIGMAEQAKRLGRSRRAIHQMRQRMGITRRRTG